MCVCFDRVFGAEYVCFDRRGVAVDVYVLTVENSLKSHKPVERGDSGLLTIREARGHTLEVRTGRVERR